MSTTTTRPRTSPTTRLLAALLPEDWRDRAVLLDAAARLDAAEPDGSLDALLAAWAHWRATGALPASPMRDLVAALATVLGGVGPELRIRPREQSRPAPCIGFRPRRRLDGTRFLAGVLDEDLHLPAGTELHLIRVRDDDAGTGPTHALRVFPPSVAPTSATLRRAAADRLDASAIRCDPRDTRETATTTPTRTREP